MANYKIISLIEDFKNIVSNIETKKELEIAKNTITNLEENLNQFKRNKETFKIIQNFFDKKIYTDKEIENLEKKVSTKDLIEYAKNKFSLSEVYVSEFYYYSFKEIINLFFINDLLKRNCKNCIYFDNFYCSLYEETLTNLDIENSYNCNNFEKI